MLPRALSCSPRVDDWNALKREINRISRVTYLQTLLSEGNYELAYDELPGALHARLEERRSPPEQQPDGRFRQITKLGSVEHEVYGASREETFGACAKLAVEKALQLLAGEEN